MSVEPGVICTAMNCFGVRTYLVLLLTCWACTAHAQGQGSYGGIASGLVQLVLVAFAVVIALVVLGIRVLLGIKAALVSLGVILVSIGIFFAKTRFAATERATERAAASKRIDRAFAEGCMRTSRSIEQVAVGNERVLIRLTGAELVSERQQYELLPSKTGGAKGVEVVTELPQDVSGAILVDIRYGRDRVPGSFEGFEWYRTRYDLVARSLADGKILARTTDMQTRSGFCLGDLEAFLERALNRPEVLHSGGVPRTIPARVLPDAYVLAEYSEPVGGRYLESATVHNALVEETTKLLTSKGCTIKDLPRLALCGTPPDGPFEVSLYGIVGAFQLRDSWLLIYRINNDGKALTSIRVEHRLSDLRLARSWHANALPSGNLEDGDHLQEFALNGGVMTAAVYRGPKWKYDRSQALNWYTERSILMIPLPGLRE
ncbi:hypothetical protein [Piscinibacter terrae]|nr:hypothetical protein [Albitalea terrae]